MGIIGGKPSKGTKADKRLGANKGGMKPPMPKPKNMGGKGK